MDPANYLPESGQDVIFAEHVDPRALLLRRIELKLKAIIEAQSVPLPDDLNPAIPGEEAKQSARKNRKLEAITMHRDLTGAGLAQAKQAIEDSLKQGDGPMHC